MPCCLKQKKELWRIGDNFKDSNNHETHLLLTYRNAASISSGSISGNSSIICSLLSPDASKSIISITLIRIPLIQGRPPHWAGFSVMRSCQGITFIVYMLAYQRYELDGDNKIAHHSSTYLRLSFRFPPEKTTATLSFCQRLRLAITPARPMAPAGSTT